MVQGWLSDQRLNESRLLLVTQGAVAVEPGEPVTDLAQAALWGLLRSTQTEHPDRFVLVDVPEPAQLLPALPGCWPAANLSSRCDVAALMRPDWLDWAAMTSCPCRTAPGGDWRPRAREAWMGWHWWTNRRPRHRWVTVRSGLRCARPG
ncbi:hypothetical protein [Saccharopolyspora spinosa]|uniref:SpnB-like Rossmann fold domain-containing protein n=1 Tax=Saccharopolyspora spinosa TaxID=60894 RepID=UPI00376EF959